MRDRRACTFRADGRARARDNDSGTRKHEYGPGDAFSIDAVFTDHVSENSVVAVQPCRTVMMTPSARRALERNNLELVVDLDRKLIATILSFPRRADRRERVGSRHEAPGNGLHRHWRRVYGGT